MLLVDTAIWIDHIRRPDGELIRLLDSELIFVHPFVVGEIALGHMKKFELFLAQLDRMPKALIAYPAEVLALIRNSGLVGSGIGYVDAHLLAATLMMPGTRLWTRDKKLRAVAERLSIAADVD